MSNCCDGNPPCKKCIGPIEIDSREDFSSGLDVTGGSGTVSMKVSQCALFALAATGMDDSRRMRQRGPKGRGFGRNSDNNVSKRKKHRKRQKASRKRNRK